MVKIGFKIERGQGGLPILTGYTSFFWYDNDWGHKGPGLTLELSPQTIMIFIMEIKMFIVNIPGKNVGIQIVKKDREMHIKIGIWKWVSNSKGAPGTLFAWHSQYYML